MRLKQLKKSAVNKKVLKIKKGPYTEWEINVIETGIKQGLTYKTIAELLGELWLL